MLDTAQQISQRQNEILNEMGRIRRMRRGTVSQQQYADRAKRREGQGATGPYFLWQGSVDGERFGKRVSGTEAEDVAEGIQQRHVFEDLCDEYVALSCQLAELEGKESASEGALKKGLKSKSRRTSKRARR